VQRRSHLGFCSPPADRSPPPSLEVWLPSRTEVYERLNKPYWAPPAGVFGPLPVALYSTTAAAGWQLWQHQVEPSAKTGLGLHAAQLALNAAWPSTFFSARNRSASLAVIMTLDVTIAAEIAVAARVDGSAAALLTPYLTWSLFATALTGASASRAASDRRRAPSLTEPATARIGRLLDVRRGSGISTIRRISALRNSLAMAVRTRLMLTSSVVHSLLSLGASADALHTVTD